MYTYMFCFLISDDFMLPHRTALFSSLCPYFMKRQKQDPLRASSRLHWKNVQAKKVCYIVLPIWTTWRHAKTLYNQGYSK